MTDSVTVLELKQDVFDANEVNADKVRQEMTDSHQLMINVMSSPGSGKTTTLVRTIKELQPEIQVGVMECDIDASVDAETIQAAGARSIQLHTGGMCHMDAQMTKQGLNEMGTEGLDLIFIENVGNLVCPAEFDTGANINMTILSVPEGDDKPAKYPLVYEVSDVVLVNKIDAMAVFDFNKELAEERIHALNPSAEIFYVSSKTGEGYEAWINWLKNKVAEAKAN
ncbi:MAG: hydrogenase nickel incorporation protein HypB, partial [Lachnospiraceae bacterium]|nr:hydrogenase nickel incorporation protein HypB [Lachnospiraceae bacterium]MBQ2089240.1 hydrogenase nickel incorporation protein HypB [Lachnospiraceae bacterium]